jgi:hypothetical protein
MQWVAAIGVIVPLDVSNKQDKCNGNISDSRDISKDTDNNGSNIHDTFGCSTVVVLIKYIIMATAVVAVGAAIVAATINNE